MTITTVNISTSIKVDVFGLYDTPLGCLEITADGQLTWTDAISARTVTLRERTIFDPIGNEGSLK